MREGPDDRPSAQREPRELRLRGELAKLDPAKERALADEQLVGEAPWPTLSPDSRG